MWHFFSLTTFGVSGAAILINYHVILLKRSGCNFSTSATKNTPSLNHLFVRYLRVVTNLNSGGSRISQTGATTSEGVRQFIIWQNFCIPNLDLSLINASEIGRCTRIPYSFHYQSQEGDLYCEIQTVFIHCVWCIYWTNTLHACC